MKIVRFRKCLSENSPRARMSCVSLYWWRPSMQESANPREKESQQQKSMRWTRCHGDALELYCFNGAFISALRTPVIQKGVTRSYMHQRDDEFSIGLAAYHFVTLTLSKWKCTHCIESEWAVGREKHTVHGGEKLIAMGKRNSSFGSIYRLVYCFCFGSTFHPKQTKWVHLVDHGMRCSSQDLEDGPFSRTVIRCWKY